MQCNRCSTGEVRKGAPGRMGMASERKISELRPRESVQLARLGEGERVV